MPRHLTFLLLVFLLLAAAGTLTFAPPGPKTTIEPDSMWPDLEPRPCETTPWWGYVLMTLPLAGAIVASAAWLKFRR